MCAAARVCCACVRCHAGKENCFGIFHPDRKTYFLQAETAGEMMSWVKAVKCPPAISDYMRELVDKCATVKDPLSDLALDITRQCINVSLSRDGKAEVCI